MQGPMRITSRGTAGLPSVLPDHVHVELLHVVGGVGAHLAVEALPLALFL